MRVVSWSRQQPPGLHQQSGGGYLDSSELTDVLSEITEGPPEQDSGTLALSRQRAGTRYIAEDQRTRR